MENKDYIKFVHNYDGTLDIKVINADCNIWDLLDKFKEFCLAMGYHPDNVDRIQYGEKSND